VRGRHCQRHPWSLYGARLNDVGAGPTGYQLFEKGGFGDHLGSGRLLDLERVGLSDPGAQLVDVLEDLRRQGQHQLRWRGGAVEADPHGLIPAHPKADPKRVKEWLQRFTLESHVAGDVLDHCDLARRRGSSSGQDAEEYAGGQAAALQHPWPYRTGSPAYRATSERMAASIRCEICGTCVRSRRPSSAEKPAGACSGAD
jgi:hypothetical protein